MKLLLDENLSPRLVDALSDLFPGSEHVDRVGLGGVEDGVVWEYAKSGGFAIVSKDSDFSDRSVIEGSPPKVIWIRLGNCSTSDVERILRTQHTAIHIFLSEDTETCLLLGRK